MDQYITRASGQFLKNIAPKKLCWLSEIAHLFLKNVSRWLITRSVILLQAELLHNHKKMQPYCTSGVWGLQGFQNCPAQERIWVHIHRIQNWLSSTIWTIWVTQVKYLYWFMWLCMYRMLFLLSKPKLLGCYMNQK